MWNNLPQNKLAIKITSSRFSGDDPHINAPANQAVLQLHLCQSLFSQGKKRFSLSPTADGYPDVETYRDLNFALEVDWK